MTPVVIAAAAAAAATVTTAATAAPSWPSVRVDRLAAVGAGGIDNEPVVDATNMELVFAWQ